MQYQIYRMDFQTPVHFGDGGLVKSSKVLCADTVFSALCIEALHAGCLDSLVQAAEDDQLRISDALPYIDQTYYIPKPLVELKVEKEGDSKTKKAMKKLDYIPVNLLETYIHGKMDIQAEADKFSKRFGREFLVEKAAVRGMDDKTDPYAVDSFVYGDGCGLYLCVGYEKKEILRLVEQLLDGLAITGIGGKISSGYGKFILHSDKADLLERLLNGDYQRYISLSVSLPKEDEMETALEDSGYRLKKRGGFIASSTYADGARKKKTVYLLQAGSSFTHRFEGSLLDVSDGSRHPVYRYAKPMFLGVM